MENIEDYFIRGVFFVLGVAFCACALYGFFDLVSCENAPTTISEQK